MSDIYAYDCETYPNFFSFTAERLSDGCVWQFEISSRRDDGMVLRNFLTELAHGGHRMVGYNNLAFDYPIIHLLLINPGATHIELYEKALAIINSEWGDWSHFIWERDRLIPQIDLFKIHHFDNKARRTSLKALEFNMRSINIRDLPYPPGSILLHHQMDDTLTYNLHDVKETVKFCKKSMDMIEFREELSVKYQRDFMNHNDTKIGKDYFIMQLEKHGIRTKDFAGNLIQTPRNSINLIDAIFPYITFNHPEFQRIHRWFQKTTVFETNGVFKDVKANVDGFQFVFGLGGIHGSIENTIVSADDEHIVRDADVTSYYPSLAIKNRVYPQHLGEYFCEIYEDVFNMRKGFKKGTTENAMLKLALNGVFGDSNNVYSAFYDPLYTMKITVNGQLLLCMLAENLLRIPGLQLIQINTDGLTVKMPRNVEHLYNEVCDWWQKFTLMDLEFADYSRMFIRDVNNYIAEYTDGKLKRKGAYEYEMQWHQDQSALVIPKAAEAALVHGHNIRETVWANNDIYDFCLRAKVSRDSSLQLEYEGSRVKVLQNVTRYYVSRNGGNLIKIMPPLKGKTDHRRIGIAVGWKVTECNHIGDALEQIDYNYYIQKTHELVEPLRCQ